MNFILKTSVSALIPPIFGIICGIILSQTEMIINSIYTAAYILLAFVTQKKFSLFPSKAYLLLLLFILLSVFAGRAFNLYGYLPCWDKVLHAFSGIIAVFTAKNLYMCLGGNPQNKKLMYTFVLSLSIATAGIWEIYEFTGDSLLGFNGQNNSLTDTMLDIICGTSAAAATAFLDIFIKHKK